MYNRVLFIGSKESGFRVLTEMYHVSPQTLVGCVTVDDRDDTRSKLDCFREFCSQNSIPLEILSGRCDLTEAVQKYQPNLCIVMGWYYVISEEILDSVDGGFIGIHNSLLPAHRGFAPVVWAMIAGEKETGFSVFSFDKNMDTGNLWYQGKVDIREDDYICDVLNRIDEAIFNFFEQHYVDILTGKIRPYAQSDEGISYGARRTPEDGHVDWKAPASEIYDFIRAQSHPYPGAKARYQNEEITIWESEVFPYPIQGTFGQVGLIEDDHVVIVCGQSSGLILRKIGIGGCEVAVNEVIKSLSYKLS